MLIYRDRESSSDSLVELSRYLSLAVQVNVLTTLLSNQIRFQPNDHKTIKETADELKIFEGIKHPNLVRYFGVELHRVRRTFDLIGFGWISRAVWFQFPSALTCRRRCTSSWSTATRARWRRCPDWGCRNTSSGSTANRSLQPSMSCTSTALFTGISRVRDSCSFCRF